MVMVAITHQESTLPGHYKHLAYLLYFPERSGTILQANSLQRERFQFTGGRKYDSPKNAYVGD